MKKIFYRVLAGFKLGLAVFVLCNTNDVFAQVVINEVHYNPANDISGDANGDGTRSSSQDEFIEIVNAGNLIDISSWTLSDGDGICFTFPSGTVLNSHQVSVVFGGGLPTGNFGGAQIFTKSLGLNNADNVVLLKDASGNIIDSMSYKTNDAVGKSLTRNPDITGDFEAYTKIGNGTVLFSPGMTVDLKSFSTLTSLENGKNNSTKIYPNPLIDKVYLGGLGGIVSLKLYTQEGDELITHLNNNVLDLGNYPSGIYYLKIVSTSNTETIRLVKL